MRIVSGSARGKKLVPFSGQKIRPTSDRIREAVFSSLYSRIGPLQGCGVLDLFAGTGAMGIEALSRGADFAVFVDNSIQAVRIIRENLESCGFPEKARIIHREVFHCWPQLHAEGPFDVIFLDPPYGKGLVEKTLTTIIETKLLTPQGILYSETPAHEELSEEILPSMLLKKNRYGSTMVHLFQFPNKEGKN